MVSTMQEKKTNRQRLEANQAAVQTHAEQVIGAQAPQIPEVNPPSTIVFEQFNIEDLSKLAAQFDTKRDQDRGIERYEQILPDGTKSMVRDARHMKPVTKEQEQMDPNSLKMLMIGSARGALFMLDSFSQSADGKAYETMGVTMNQARDELYVLFNQHLQTPLPQKKADIKQMMLDYNGKIVDIMKRNGIDKLPGIDLVKDLDLASHAMNIHNENAHISTITTVDKKTIIESDLMALGVTQNQKEMLLDIRNPINSVTAEPWFEEQTPFRQALIRDVAQNVVNDKGEQMKVMPTQLRTLMPLAKNVGLKVTSVVDDAGKVQQVSENLHSGAIFFSAKAADEYAKTRKGVQLEEMAKQVASFTPEGVKLNQVNSTSPINPFNRAEKQADEQSAKAMQATGNFATTTPFNTFRKVSKNRTDGYDAVLSSVASATFSEFGHKGVNISQYLNGKGKLKEATKQLATLKDEHKTDPKKLQILDTLETAINAKELLNKGTSFFERKFGNNNLKLFEYFSELNTAIHTKNGALKEGLSNPQSQEALNQAPYMSFNCMSGKDRTGVAMFTATVMSVSKFFKETFGTVEKQQDVAQVINMAGHTQQIPSQNNIGSHGVKSDSETAQKTPIFKDNLLTRATASFNKFKANLEAKFEVMAKDVHTYKDAYQNTARSEGGKAVQDLSKPTRQADATKRSFADRVRSESKGQSQGQGQAPF